MRKFGVILLAFTLLFIGGCEAVEDEVRQRAEEEVDRQSQRLEDRVNDEIDERSTQIEDRVEEEVNNLTDGQNAQESQEGQ